LSSLRQSSNLPSELWIFYTGILYAFMKILSRAFTNLAAHRRKK